MLNKVLVLACVLLIPGAASAEWQIGGQYVNFSADDDGIDVDLGGLAGSVGYSFDNGGYRLVPELRLGIGLGDDDVSFLGTRATVEIERFVALSLNAEIDVSDSVYLFAKPSYTNVEIEVSAAGMSASDDEWEFGLGVGGGIRFSDAAALEIGYETYDGTDVFTIGMKFTVR